MKLKQWLRLFFPVLILMAACHAPTSVQTPQGRAAYTADQVVKRVGELQNAAIQANATVDASGHRGLNDSDTRLIVQACVAMAQTLKTTPQGWEPSVKVAWANFKKQAPPGLFNAVTPIGIALASFDAFVGGL